MKIVKIIFMFQILSLLSCSLGAATKVSDLNAGLDSMIKAVASLDKKVASVSGKITAIESAIAGKTLAPGDDIPGSITDEELHQMALDVGSTWVPEALEEEAL